MTRPNRGPAGVRRPLPARLLLGVAAALAAASGGTGGCDDPPPRRSAAVPATTQAAEADPPMAPIDFAALGPAEPTPARPGYLVGRVLGEDGKPVRTPGVRIEVKVTGVREDAQNVNLRFEANGDGTFARKLEPGTYTSVTARIEFPFEDRTYRLPLVPAHGTDPRQDAATGVVQDFAWKLTGLRPGAAADAERPEPWIGGSIHANYVGVDTAQRRPIRSAPRGTAVRFTLTPKGPLADGRRGDPVVAVRRYDASGSALDRPLLTDLPLARFVLTGVEERPDGSRRAVLFLQTDNETWAESVEGTFTPDLARASLEPQGVQFRRQEN